MSVLHRLILALAALLLGALYFLPMWSITLEAPQYPKGNELGILIYINEVTGARPNDLQNLNGLNHYIGMKPIEADAIPELKYMPIIVGFLIGVGLMIAAIGKRWMIVLWMVLLVAAGSLGMYDFWLWEYDYGHNLNPHAAIRIDGMSYQPPLIGEKQLLNFKAYSYPAIGFYFIIASSIFAALAWWMGRKKT